LYCRYPEAKETPQSEANRVTQEDIDRLAKEKKCVIS
jgi:hypothetical protein